MSDDTACCIASKKYFSERCVNMKKTGKTNETLKKELATLTNAELGDLFKFYYRINHQHENLTSFENFNKFLISFDKNPFQCHEDKEFRMQMIDNLIEYTDDQMSLIAAVVLLKRKFSIDEIIENYYANVNAFDNDMF